MAVRFYKYSFCSFNATHGVVKRKRSVCVGTTKRIGNVACVVNAMRTCTLRVLFYDRYCGAVASGCSQIIFAPLSLRFTCTCTGVDVYMYVDIQCM